jgi:arylsulfatase A-like enzyme
VFYGGGVPRPGLVIDEPVRSIDIMPTLLHLFDLRAPAHLQGQSLVPLLRAAAGMESPGDDWIRRPIVSQKIATEDERMSPPPRKVGKTAISDGRWKLVHNEPRAEGEPEFELYDRQIDPLDRHDLASEHPEIVAGLRQQLDEWTKEVGRVRLDAEGSGEIDAEALRDIRAMGYAK